MMDFLEAQDFFAHDIKVCLTEATFRGAGFLRWNPSTGFSFDMVVTSRDEHSIPDRIDIPGGPAMAIVTTARLMLGKSFWAITPITSLREDFGLWSGQHISRTTSVALFRREHEKAPTENGRYHCGTTINVLPSTLLPDKVIEEVTLSGRTTRRSFRLAGLDIDRDRERLRAETHTPGVIQAWWVLDEASWPRGSDWRSADAFADALGIMTGQRARVVQRRSLRGRREYQEVRWVRKGPEDLGFQAPIGDSSAMLNKDHLYSLFAVLTRGGPESVLCRNIFGQLADASQQRTWQARELLTATILEGIMRTVYKKPFIAGEKAWDFRQPLRDYSKKLFGPEWLTAADRAFETQRRLRHRNAHPDWRLDNAVSGAQLVEAIDDLIYLSRFYGFFMLAVSGIRGILPRFPAPHKEWPPLVTISLREAENRSVSASSQNNLDATSTASPVGI
jgi:hypothetical protein